jgi:uncharacterized protein YggT (Ycf19 family)
MEIERDTMQQDPVTGTTQAVHTKQEVPGRAAVSEAKGMKANSIIWYIVGIINTLLIIRILLFLLGAHRTGFAFIYNLTHPLVAPFMGIFSSPTTGTSFFDTAGLLAVIVVSLIGWAIASLITISSDKSTRGTDL